MLWGTKRRRYVAQDLSEAVDPIAYAWSRLPVPIGAVLHELGARYRVEADVLDAFAQATLCRGWTVADVIRYFRSIEPQFRSRP